MMTRRFALLAPLMLAACTALPGPQMSPASAPAGQSYFALGTEPGWTLEITPERLNYLGDYGATRIVVPNPGGRPSFNGMRYVTPRLTVDVTYVPCNDGMSDRRYADRVTVETPAGRVSGCGGIILPPADLQGGTWGVTAIAGAALGPPTPTMSFGAGELSGTTGCNRFAGRYDVSGATLTITGLTSTRMACHGEPGAREARLLAALAAPMRLRLTREGRMLLTASNGTLLTLDPG